MTVKLCAFTCGTLSGALGNLMAGGKGDITIPVPAFLIEHDKGRALFDTGLHPALQHDPAARLGTRLADMFRVGFEPGEEVSARLEAIDRDPGKIDLLIASHLHFDHVGGNALIPNATLLVQRREWEVGQDHERAQQAGFQPQDYDLGHRTRVVDGEHDVFGDGSVVCLPTHGHTPGHQSLRLQLESGEVVLAGDACYFCETLRARRLPPRMFDRDAMLASLDRLEALERGGADFSPATTPNSGRPCRKRPLWWGKRHAFVCRSMIIKVNGGAINELFASFIFARDKRGVMLGTTK